MFINIHSHHPGINNEWVIQNCYQHFKKTVAGNWYSMGLHPWYIDAVKWPQQLQALVKHSHNSNVLAIGECGLDKVCHTNFALQQNLFNQQIALANNVGKPLIIHCVKAYNEVQLLLHKNKVQVPVIFHGFNKNRQLAQQLIGKGYYLSFGKALQLPGIQQVIADLPMQQVFLETDNDPFFIETIYTLAAQALQIDINTLSLQIKKNAAAVFGESVLPV